MDGRGCFRIGLGWVRFLGLGALAGGDDLTMVMRGLVVANDCLRKAWNSGRWRGWGGAGCAGYMAAGSELIIAPLSSPSYCVTDKRDG